jgi:hypothetical protein
MNSSTNVVSQNNFGIGGTFSSHGGGPGTTTSFRGVGASIIGQNAGSIVVPHVKLQNIKQVPPPQLDDSLISNVYSIQGNVSKHSD